MIKTLAIAMMVLMMTITASNAADSKGIHEPGTGLVNPDLKKAAQGTGQGLQAINDTNVSTPGIHEPGTGITNPEVKEAAQGTGQGTKAQAGQPAERSQASPQKTQPGFEAIFSIMGLVAMASIAFRGKN
jgi:hypothetical protein